MPGQFNRVWLTSLALTISGCSTAWATDMDAATRAGVLGSQSRLTEALIDKLGTARPGDNVMVSPASAAGLLAAIDLGAGETMHAAIRKTLQLQPGPKESSDLQTVLELTAKGLSEGGLTSATRLVFDRAVSPSKTASDRLSAAGVDAEVRDLHTAEMVQSINAWGARATHGRIDHALTNVPEAGIGLVALNALYFKGGWNHFDADATAPADFRKADGQRIRAKFMHSYPRAFELREDDGFVAVDLPFQGARFSMVVLTTKDRPAAADAFRDHLAWLTGLGFAPGGPRMVLDLPRFSVQSDDDLLPALAALGLDLAAPFSGFSDLSFELTTVKQIVDFRLDEQGAEVAAITRSGFEVSSKLTLSADSEVLIDKPFAFALRDEQTGLIVAAGYIAKVPGEQVAAEIPVLSAHSEAMMTKDEMRVREQLKVRAARVRQDPQHHPMIERDF